MIHRAKDGPEPQIEDYMPTARKMARRDEAIEVPYEEFVSLAMQGEFGPARITRGGK